MCDFSLHAVRSRPAKVGDRLTTQMFNLGTSGFCAPEDERMAVCLLPGTEVSFADQRSSDRSNLHNRALIRDPLEVKVFVCDVNATLHSFSKANHKPAR
jgi:hypothetical protein